MSEATDWDGFASPILDEVVAVLKANGALGLQTCMVGEQQRGFAYPACFVHLAPEGMTKAKASGRVGTDDWRIPVRLAVVLKHMTKSLDGEAMALMEKCMDAVEAAWRASPGLHGVHDLQAADPIQVVPVSTQGFYETVGTCNVAFHKKRQRAR